MDIINIVLGRPLGFIIYLAYQLTGNYGASILIFTVIARIALLPITIMAHKNSIRLLQIQPALDEIKKRYGGERERLNEEQYNLFKKEEYSPFVGIVPLLIQLILVIGILQVMYHPLQHILRFDQSIIDALILAAREIYSAQPSSVEQLLVIAAMKHPENLPIFQTALAGFAGFDNIIQVVANTNLNFLGLNLGVVPSFTNPSPALVIPPISGFSALAMCLVQTYISPGALSQGKKTNYGLTIFTVALSVYFTLVMPVGVGVYWITGNVIGIALLLLVNLLYSPHKLAGEALSYIKANQKSAAQLKEERQKIKALNARQKQDAARFNTTKKQLVFYALTGGQYKYYKNIIEYILEHSNIIIHYLTNDPEDAIFKQKNERLTPYYASQQKTVSLMLRLDTDIMVTTVPGLNNYHLKRSAVRDDIEYIYVFHAIGGDSFMGIRENALDHYDTVFCTGPGLIPTLRKREKMAGLPRKKLVKAGYGLYDQLVESYSAISHIVNEKPQILIAPSWQVDNLLDICIDDMLEALLGKGYRIIVRPHPQYINMFPERIKLLTERYSGYALDKEITFGLDFFDNKSIFLSDVLITDWSSIAFEFSYSTLKPCIFINTPMKILNENYKQYEDGEVPYTIALRNKAGISVDVNNINKLDKIVVRLLTEKNIYKDQIEQLAKDQIFHPGKSGEAGGKYIINQLKQRQVFG